MTAATYLLLYGAAVSWLAPPMLTRLTGRGLNPQLGVAAWLTAIAAVLTAWAVAVALIVSASVTGLPGSATVVLCLEMLGIPERSVTPGAVSLTVLVVAGLLISALVAVRVSRTVAGSRARSCEHAAAARILGAPTDRPDVFVISADRPAAYCVAGRPHAIVLTTAAVQTLDAAQLGAVLAHEDAHLAGRHHHLLMVLRALADSLSRLPLFTRGAAAVAQLLEMCADDSAIRRHGSRPLIAGMLKLAGAQPAVGGLAVAAHGVAARVTRLQTPADRITLGCHKLAGVTVIAATVVTPILINLVCRH